MRRQDGDQKTTLGPPSSASSTSSSSSSNTTVVSRKVFPLQIHPSCFAGASSYHGSVLQATADPMVEMRFDFKPASLRQSGGTCEVAHNGETTLVLQQFENTETTAVGIVPTKRVFHGHATVPERPRFYLIKQPDEEGGGYVLRGVHEVCQLSLSGSAMSSHPLKPTAAASAVISGCDAEDSMRPQKRRRRRRSTAVKSSDATAATAYHYERSDGGSPSLSSSDSDAIALLEAELLP